MAAIIAIDDAKKNEFDVRFSKRVPFLNSDVNNPALPSAFLSQGEPNRVIEPHYHDADEFLLIVGGGGVLGRHKVEPVTAFFARANTAYGPIVGAADTGISFFVLFRNFDPGAKYLPEKRDALKAIKNRRPLAVARKLPFGPLCDLPRRDVTWETHQDLCDSEGLFVQTLNAGPRQRTTAPSPAGGGGQYIVVTGGSFIHAGKEHRRNSLVHLNPGDPAFEIVAGADGVQAVVMNFPGTDQGVRAAPVATPPGAKWRCDLCQFTYSEAAGLPADGIAPGTRWDDLPADWTCPDCASARSEFRQLEPA